VIFFHRFLSAVRWIACRQRVERDLDEELRVFVEMAAADEVRQGRTPEDARRRALIRLGGVEQSKERVRHSRRGAWVDDIAQDVRYAARTFRGAPLAALTIVSTVAVGLGLIAAVFTIFSALYLRPDAVERPEQLFAIVRPTAQGATTTVRWTRREYEALRKDATAFVDVLAMVPSVEAHVEGRRISGSLVSGNFFAVLGSRARVGRALVPADDQPLQGQPVIVLSHRGWKKLFAGDATAVGDTLQIDGRPFAIVGVMPEEFRGLSRVAPDFWAPLAMGDDFPRGATVKNGSGEMFIDNVVGRLRPGLSQDAATSALAAWASTSAASGTLRVIGSGPASVRLKPSYGLQGAALALFTPIFVAFGLILVIGCVNVANLLLARGVSRQREIGVRLAMGASRSRIVRQLLTESLLLSLAGAAGGFAVSRLILESGTYFAMAEIPPQLAEGLNLAPPSADWRVALFLVTSAVVSTAFFALVPAFRATRLQLISAMRGEVTSYARPGRVRHALIAAQVSASVLFLICAGVFLRGAFVAATADLGLRTDDTLIIPFMSESTRSAVISEVRTHPFVASIAASSPSVGRVELAAVEWIMNDAVWHTPSRRATGYQLVSSEFFRVLGIDVVKGRTFAPEERSVDAGVAVVSSRLARRLWPEREAVGQVMRVRVDKPGVAVSAARAYGVIGVVQTIETPAGPFAFEGADLYLPVSLDTAGASLVLRVHGDPELARRALRGRLAGIDPALGEVGTLQTATRLTASLLRIAFWTTVVLGGLALALTASGLFSVLSYLVAQRAREIGVRLALGATARNVASLMLWQSLAPVGVGLLTGGALAGTLATCFVLTLGGLNRNLLDVYDPVAYAVGGLATLAACVMAVALPAWRAARLDPIETLRQD
jgi:predicted permease